MSLGEKLRAKLALVTLRLLSIFPLWLSQKLGWLVGQINYVMDTRAAKVSRTNLEICFPEMTTESREKLIRDSLVQTGMTMMETPAVWLGRLDRMRKWIRRLDQEFILTEALHRGRGVIVLLPHSGNWELLNVYFANSVRMTALYQPPDQAYLQPIMADIREHYGNEMVPTDVRGISTLFKRLASGAVTVVLPDQVPASGEYVPFFGMDALTDKLISRLILKTGATVVCCRVRRLPGAQGFDICFTKPDESIYSSELLTSMAAVSSCVEACALADPAQYQWEYKRFRQRPKGMLRLYNYNNSPYTHHL